jgi:magnesium chelatase family protein
MRETRVIQARRLTTMLPAMTLAEAIVTTRRFRAPHHTISDVGLISGGHVPLPGEVWPAHHSMLGMDELPECQYHASEVLRQMVENGITSRQWLGCHRPRRVDRAIYCERP